MMALKFVLAYLLCVMWCNCQGTQAIGDPCPEPEGDRLSGGSEPVRYVHGNVGAQSLQNGRVSLGRKTES